MAGLNFEDLVQQVVQAHEHEISLLRAELSKIKGAANGGDDASPARIAEEKDGSNHDEACEAQEDALERGQDARGQPVTIVSGASLASDDRPLSYSTLSRRGHSLNSDMQPGRKLANIELEPDQSPWKQFLRGPLDCFCTCLILFNALQMSVQLGLQGQFIGANFRNETVPPELFTLEKACSVLDYIFSLSFLIELTFRLCILRTRFFWDPERRRPKKFNIFDGCIVVASCVDVFLLTEFDVKLGFVRIIRLMRLTRALRLVRVFKSFSPLRVLVTTVLRSLSSLVWSMVLLFALMFMAAILLCEGLQPYMVDGPDAMPRSERLELFEMYGTSGNALWTVFQLTFSGCWPSFTHKIVRFHPLFAVLIVWYVTFVVFAATRIVTALFLKDTLKAAEADADMMVSETMEKKRTYIRKLHELFNLVNVSGDGKVTIHEFEEVIGRPQVRAYLELLDVQFSEVQNLFNLLQNGSTSISYNDFLQGILKLKGQARRMDMVQLLKETHELRDVCERIEKRFKPEQRRHHHQHPP